MGVLKDAFDFRADENIRKQAEDDDETKNVDFMVSRGKRKSPDQSGVEAGLKRTKKFDTPTRAAAALGGKKDTAGGDTSMPQVHKMTLEHTDNGRIKSTHAYKGDLAPQVHALDHKGVMDHVNEYFNMANENKAINAKVDARKTYEKEHGALLPGKVEAPAAPPASPDKYDNIRSGIRAKLAKPSKEPVTSLLDRADKIIKSSNQ